jgi:hypothetical protein
MVSWVFPVLSEEVASITPLVTTENQLRMAVLSLQGTYGLHAVRVCHDQEVFLI